VLLVIVAAIFVTFVIADYNYTPNKEEGTKLNEQLEHEPPKGKEMEPNQIKEQIRYMTLDEKIGQLFIAGIEGTSLTDYERDKFERNALGGAILFKNNLDTPEQSIQLINDFK